MEEKYPKENFIKYPISYAQTKRYLQTLHFFSNLAAFAALTIFPWEAFSLDYKNASLSNLTPLEHTFCSSVPVPAVFLLPLSHHSH